MPQAASRTRPGRRATVLAFDLGASTGRALVGELLEDGEGRRLAVTEVHRFPNGPVETCGHLYWDILRLLQEVKTGIRKAFQNGFRPESFGIDTWGVDFGLIDRNGELVGNPYHYRDAQTEGLIDEVAALVGRRELYEQGGLQFMPFNTIYQLYAMAKARTPRLDAAETLLLTPDLITYLLTGRKVCEFTMATTTQLLHPLTKTWNTPLMERLGIPPRLFLDVVPPGTRVGPLSDAVCRELGVPPVEAVAVATHDTESAAAAVPAGGETFVYLVCGTWSLLGTELDRPLLTPRAMELAYSNEGGVGDSWQLLKNIMGLWILQECRREWEEQGLPSAWSDLVDAAREAPPFRSLIDPDDLRFYAPGSMLGEIRGFCRDTGQPVPETQGQVTRCVLESLALRYRQAVDQLELLTGRSFRGLHMVGGGIRNELLCRFAANALARPVWAGPVEASAIGNMLVQLIALGHCRDLRDARVLVRDTFSLAAYEPDPAESPSWEEARRKFAGICGTG
jgi:rhamnulokinase